MGIVKTSGQAQEGKVMTNAMAGKEETAGGGGNAPELAPLYAKREKVHPKRVWGLYRKLKWVALIVLLAIYYIAPWLRWDRGPGVPDQAFLIDMPARRAYFLSIEIWPQEVYYLAAILICGALGLFLATSLFGRVWCGFACPQTVWTDFYVWVERFVEGDRAARIRLDKAPWSFDKIRKRVVKHFIWLLIALLTGGAWIMYFADAPTLVKEVMNLEVSGNVLFFTGLFTATTYLLAGFAREQVCTYMCPWPRIQSAMLDEDSMIVTYEAWRGEPRSKPARDGNYENRGHCIDCNNCVVVCPTGIDIRDGNQLECIGCGLCIDACNNVMDKLDLPRNLIAYDSTNRQHARSEQKKTRIRFVRPRTIFYAILMIIGFSVMGYSLTTRSFLDVSVLRDRNPLFIQLKDGSIRNGYTLKILNKTQQEQSYVLEIKGLDQAQMKVTGHDDVGARLQLKAEPDSVKTYKLYVTAPKAALSGQSTDMQLVLSEVDKDGSHESVVKDSVFIGPKK